MVINWIETEWSWRCFAESCGWAVDGCAAMRTHYPSWALNCSIKKNLGKVMSCNNTGTFYCHWVQARGVWWPNGDHDISCMKPGNNRAVKKKGFRLSMHAHIKCTDIYSLTVRLFMPNINIFDSAALLLFFQAFLRTCVLLKDFQYGDRLVLFCCETSKGFTWNDWEMAASPNKGNVT